MPGKLPEPDSGALSALNESLRRVERAVRVSRAPSALLADARAVLDDLAAKLDPHGDPGPYTQMTLRAGLPRPIDPELARDASRLFPYSPVVGPLNPISPPIEFEYRDGVVRAEAVFDARYAGPPGPRHGSVHGGVVALVMDELLGYVNVANGIAGPTGTLTVRYLAFTPIGEPIRMEGRFERREGRKIFARGEFRHEGRVTAEAEGVFVTSVFPAP